MKIITMYGGLKFVKEMMGITEKWNYKVTVC